MASDKSASDQVQMERDTSAPFSYSLIFFPWEEGKHYFTSLTLTASLLSQGFFDRTQPLLISFVVLQTAMMTLCQTLRHWGLTLGSDA
jgi:hypothetical protein